MTSNERTGNRILGSLRSADGKGVVRIEDRFDTDIDDLWSALTDPLRLARWLGEAEGDLRLGGEFRARFFASGREGTGRVEACESPRRLLLLTMRPGKPEDAYGAGIQVHVEDLAAYLAGGECCDSQARWAELEPAYQDLAVTAD
jgi:uncharacterized protein YndB with AHSA1/START domain